VKVALEALDRATGGFFKINVDVVVSKREHKALPYFGPKIYKNQT